MNRYDAVEWTFLHHDGIEVGHIEVRRLNGQIIVHVPVRGAPYEEGHYNFLPPILGDVEVVTSGPLTADLVTDAVTAE